MGLWCWNRNYSYYVLYSAGSKLGYFGKDEVYYGGTGECYKLSLYPVRNTGSDQLQVQIVIRKYTDFPVLSTILLDCSETIFQLSTAGWAYLCSRVDSRTKQVPQTYKCSTWEFSLLHTRKQSLLLCSFSVFSRPTFPLDCCVSEEDSLLTPGQTVPGTAWRGVASCFMMAINTGSGANSG